MTTTRTLSRALAVGAVGVAVLASSAGVASAYVGQTKGLPYFNGSGSITMSGYYSGTARWDYVSGPYCLYVQYKHVAVAGVDGTWNRLTGNDCGGYSESASFYKPTDRAFNGMKFRLCQDRPNDFDPCGDSTTIYV